jgi:F-type H+-transporting ATPase subunit a
VADATNPIEQFEIKSIADFVHRRLNLSFTNSSYFMVVAAVLVTGLLALAMSKRALVPGRAQSVAELLYEFVAGMIRSTAGDAGLKFFPLRVHPVRLHPDGQHAGHAALLPGAGFERLHRHQPHHRHLRAGDAGDRHVIVYGFMKHGFGFLKLFVPEAFPAALVPLVTMIEVISFLSRPISLSVRLFANMLAGHIF